MHAPQPLYSHMKMKITEHSTSDELIPVHRALYSLHKKGDNRALHLWCTHYLIEYSTVQKKIELIEYSMKQWVHQK